MPNKESVIYEEYMEALNNLIKRGKIVDMHLPFDNSTKDLFCFTCPLAINTYK